MKNRLCNRPMLRYITSQHLSWNAVANNA